MRCCWRAVLRRCTTANPGGGYSRTRRCGSMSTRIVWCAVRIARGAKRSSVAARSSTTFASRWLQPVGRRTSNDFPSRATPLIWPRLTFTPLEVVTDVQRRRAEAILQRRTDRLPLDYPTYWESFEPMLCSSVAEGAAMLEVLPDEARAQLAQASRLTEFLRQEDITYQAELQWWTAPFVAYEGVPPEALASSLELHRVDVAREFPSRGRRRSPRRRGKGPVEDPGFIHRIRLPRLMCWAAGKRCPPCCSNARWPAWRRARSLISSNSMTVGTSSARSLTNTENRRC